VRPDGDQPSVNDQQFVVFVMMLINCLCSDMPYLVTVFEGEEGSGKTTTIANSRSVIDPSVVVLKPWPKNEHDLYVGAQRSHLLPFDNVSKMPAEMSDAICRLSTGGYYGTRMLYTDDDEMLFRAIRPVWISGINNVVWKSDLIDRTIFLNLEPISARKTRADFAAAFELVRPKIFGLLLSIAAHGMRRFSKTPNDPAGPRMADFDKFSRACESFAWKPGTFRAAYNANRLAFKSNIVKYDLVANAISYLMDFEKEWHGSATELYEQLDEAAGKLDGYNDSSFPAAPNALTRKLRLIAPIMRQVRGIDIRTDDRTNAAREVVITHVAYSKNDVRQG